MDPSLGEGEEVPVDEEARKLMASKNHKGMVKKLGKSLKVQVL